MGTLGFKLKPFNLPVDTFFGTAVNTVTGTSTPGTPPSGSAYIWFDSGLKKWRAKYDNGTIESLGVGTSGAANHKDTHISGGSDDFDKNDNIDAACRYLEDIGDPASDSQRVWIVDGGSEIRYWDDQGTPVKQTVATTGTAQTISNKILNDTNDISAAVTAAGFALLGADQTFTAPQEILSDAENLLELSRPTSTISNLWGIDLWAQDVATNWTKYCQIKAKITDNTDGSEDSVLNFYNMVAGVETNMFQVKSNGIAFGANLRGALAETGLTAQRTITFQDSSYKVAGIDRANTYTSGAQTFQVKAEFNKETAFTGIISPTQITSDQNNYTPTNLLTSSVVRLDADSSFRSITGLGDATQVSGQRLRLRNISANTILLKDTITNKAASSTAANRFDFGGWDYPLFSKCDVDVAYDSTLSRWVMTDPAPFVFPTQQLGLFYETDRLNLAAVDGILGAPTAASGGTATGIAGEAGHEGITRFTLGTSATGSASVLAQDTSGIIFGNSIYWRYDAIIRMNALSNATDRFTLRVGFIDSGTAESTDGVFFRYVDNVNSGKWVLVARSNTTETATNATATAPAGATWYRLTIIINPAGNSAEFFQDNTYLGEVTTNIPTGAGRNSGPGMMFLKSAGTTNNTGVDLDAIQVVSYHNVTR
jgi:hypothetical protein